MYGSYNQAQYYNGIHHGQDTRYYQGNARNPKAKDDRKPQNPASSHQNGLSSSQQPDRYNQTTGPRYNKYPYQNGTRMFNNSQQKKWQDKQAQFSNPNPSAAGKLRHGPPEPSPTQKPAERVNGLKKPKPYFKQPVDEKENSEKEAVCVNGLRNPIVSKTSAPVPQKNSADNKIPANRQGGRKQNSGRNGYPCGKNRNKKEQYKQHWEQMNFFSTFFCAHHPHVVYTQQTCRRIMNVAPMTRCLRKSAVMVTTSTPDNLTDGSCWDKLSEAIWNKFYHNQQCEETYCLKIHLWEFLYVIIRAYFPRYGLYLVGSSLNGFALGSSDVDLCLMIHHMDMDQRTEAQMYLGSILGVLSTYAGYLEGLELIHAKVPLLKFRDVATGLQVDLNCNNSVGIRNTHLLHGYSQMDWRVKPLVILVKIWAQCHDINDAKCMTLSSYSLTLMVIHFLQCGVHPAILPSLQKLYPEKYNNGLNIGVIHIPENIPPYQNDNTQTLGELFLRFFQYYTRFDFKEDAISVRLGCTIPVETCRYAKASKNDPMQWKYINIEEPYDLTNTARSVHEPSNYQRILKVFSLSADALEESKDLNSVLTPSR